MLFFALSPEMAASSLRPRSISRKAPVVQLLLRGSRQSAQQGEHGKNAFPTGGGYQAFRIQWLITFIA